MEAIDNDFDAEIEAKMAEIRNHNITKGSRKNYEKSVAKFVAFPFLTNIHQFNPAFFYSPPPLCAPTEENVGVSSIGTMRRGLNQPLVLFFLVLLQRTSCDFVSLSGRKMGRSEPPLGACPPSLVHPRGLTEWPEAPPLSDDLVYCQQ